MEVTLSPSTFEALSSTLGPTERKAFSDNARRLQALASDAKQMTEFLSAFGETVAELYAASSVAIWFRAPAETDKPMPYHPTVAVGWKNLGLDKPSERAHSSLVSFAFQQNAPFAVRPYSAAHPHAAVSNPTDSFILFGPVEYEQQVVAVLQIALGPKPLRRPHQELVAAYLEWLNWLGHLLQSGIAECFTNASQPLLQALETVHHATTQAEAMQNQIRAQIESSIRTLAGQNFGSLRENQAVVKQVHELLESKALRVKCPECGAAAILRCQKAGNSKNGAFMYDHYLDTGRTFHGGQTTFPEVTLVAKPARRRKA